MTPHLYLGWADIWYCIIGRVARGRDESVLTALGVTNSHNLGKEECIYLVLTVDCNSTVPGLILLLAMWK